MIIEYKTPKLKAFLLNTKKMRGKYGPRAAENFQDQYSSPEAADNLAIYGMVERLCHELKGTRKFQLAVDLNESHGRGGLRLVFEPIRPIPLKPDGGLDRNKVTGITILKIEDYH